MQLLLVGKPKKKKKKTAQQLFYGNKIDRWHAPNKQKKKTLVKDIYIE